MLAVATITVDTISDEDVSDSELSIREAILLANGGTGASGLNRALHVDEVDNVSGTPGAASADTITFSDPPFAAGAPVAIIVNPALPSLLGGNDTIDATGRGVIIDGAAEPSPFPCVLLASTGNTVMGLQLTDCSSGVFIDGVSGNTVGPGNTMYDNSSGVSITGSSNTIKGNKMGTSVDGTELHPAGGNGDSVTITGDGNTIGGTNIADRNIISGNTFNGIRIDSTGSGNIVIGNYIGTDITGTLDRGNTGNGIFMNGDGNVVGGTSAGSGNVISGNNLQGVSIGAGGDSNLVQGNIIGLDATGTIAIGNSFEGVQISAALNSVGGTDPGARNIISGNLSNGVSIPGAGVTGNTVQGNYIGTDITGTLDRGNGTNGVSLGGSSGNTIGGTGAGAGNLISGNARGVLITGSSNFIQGNLIGTDAAGTSAIANSLQGVSISGNSNTIGGVAGGAGNVISGNGTSGVELSGMGNSVQANNIGMVADGLAALGNALDGERISNSLNVVGGPTEDSSNGIAYNGGDGVFVSSGTQNAIRSNSIHSNAGLGIDLGSDGVTLNDDNTGDADAGANNLQNFPVLTSVTLVPNTSVSGTLNSTPDTTFTVDFYHSASCDSSGNGEGERFIGFSNLTTNAMGNISFAVALPGTIPATRFVAATATDPAGNTSEFSGCVPSLDDTDDDDDGYTDVSESGAPLCAANVNDDAAFDTGEVGANARFNDGCPAVGPAEVDCTDALDNDGDGAFNDGCPQMGTYSEAQFKIGTGHMDPCGNNGWPADVFSTGLSVNKLDLQDLGSFVAPPPRRLNTNPGEAGFSSRWDLLPGSVAGKFINIQDIAASAPSTLASTSRPPMFGGAPAFGQVCPFPP